MATKTSHESLRPVVVLIFLPGFYLVLLAAAGLSSMIAVLGVKFGIAVAGRYPFAGVSVVASCAIAGGAGVFSAVRAAIESMRAAAPRVEAVRVGRSEASGVWTSISKVSRRLKCPPPDNLVLALGPETFVTDGQIHAYDGRHTGRTLCISAPLLRVLSVEEFESVLAHEMAHFTGHDTLYSHYFYPVYRGSLHAMRELREEAGEGGWQKLVLAPSMYLVAGYLGRFASVEKKISRTRELRADAIAAELSGREIVIQALTKVHAYAPFWPLTEEWIACWLKENNAFENVPAFFVECLRRNKPALVRCLGSASQLSHPLHSHPSFAERAQALGNSRLSAELETREPLAATLFSELGHFEERLTELRTLEIMRARPGHFFTKRKQPAYDAMSLSF
jgi:Zn-dependent protease with chaperone function